MHKGFSLETPDIAHLLSLDPQTIDSRYGEDVLWHLFNITPHPNVFGYYLVNQKGKNPEWMLYAKRVAYHLGGRYTVLKALYDLIDCTSREISQFDLKSALKENAKATLSEKRLDDYSLSLLMTRDHLPRGVENIWGLETVGGKEFQVYLDSPVGVALMYKGLPNAVIGFFIYGYTLMIYQIQGVRPIKIDYKNKRLFRGSSRGLAPIAWERVLVDFVEHIGKKLGYKQIGIQSGYNNPWAHNRCHFTLEMAIKRYDMLAQSLGYQQGDDANWYKSL